jgi:glucoside 3-dehydrogenase (cytochrome c) hitch-hiker subunit
MNRRQLIRLLAGTALASAIPGELFAAARQAHSEIGSGSRLRTLNPHQDAMLTAICELIIPATDTPGAKAARVNEFIDLVLTEWYEEEERNRFLGGLADVDTHARSIFGKDFVDSSEKQQIDILTALDQELTSTRESVLPSMLARDKVELLEKHYFYMIKRLTLFGYYTSDIGLNQELHYEVIPTEHAGCAPISEATESSKR